MTTVSEVVDLLAGVGAASRAAVWAPVLAWTALGVAVEAALRRSRPAPAVGLWTRGALLALLPALVVGVPALAPWVPALHPAPPPVVVVQAPPAPAFVESGGAVAVAAEVPRPALTPDVWIGLATAVAALASLAALVVLGGGVAWLARHRRRLDAAAPPVQDEARAAFERLGVRRAVEVKALPPESAPFVAGWRRPVVAIPSDLAGEPLRFALAHEAAHVRGAHFAWRVAERAVGAAFVWHPLVHVLGWGLALDRERVADAAVVGLWPDRAACYGRLLTLLAQRPTPPLALGASSSPLLYRLDAMTRPRPARRRLARAAGLALFAVPLVLAAAAVPDPAEAPRLVVAAEADDAFDRAATTTAPLDSLDAYVAQRFGSYSRRGVEIEIQLKAGVPRSVAERVAKHYADGSRSGSLVVAYDGGRLTRSTLRADGLPPPPPPPPRMSAYAEPGSDDFRDVVVDRGSEFRGNRMRIGIRLKPGEPRATAERVADFYADSDRPGQVVVAYDGGQVVRWTVREDRLPPAAVGSPVVDGGAASAPPPPPARADSLDAYVARRIGSYGDRGNRVEICLEPGASRAVAERVAEHYADGSRSGTLVVAFDGGQVTHSTLRDGRLPPPPAWPARFLGPGWTADAPFMDVVESHRATYETGQPDVYVRLAAGETRETAERVAGYYGDGPHAGRLVVAYDGGQVERTTLRADGLPAPTPQTCR